MLDSKLNVMIKHSDGSESPVFWEYEGKEELDTEMALKYLIEHDLVHVNFFPFAYKTNDPANHTVNASICTSQ